MDTHDPWRQGWPPQISRTPSRPRSSDTDMIGDMRERLATLEAHFASASQILRDRAHSQAERMSRIDERLTEGDRRMTEADGRLTALEAEQRRCRETETFAKALGDRVLTIEQRRAAALAWMQYTAAAAIGGLTLSGQLDLPTALGWILKLLGLA